MIKLLWIGCGKQEPRFGDTEKFAKLAVATIARGDSYRIIPWQMGWVAKILRVLPNWLYDILFAKAPRKERDHE